MHFVRAGQGAPPILFVHGFACSHQDWKFQFEHFSKRHEVVACDLRGHGQTPGRPAECSIEHYGGDVAALIMNLELEKTILVGHSMGCRVVLEAARLAPNKVSALVLVDGSRLASGDPAAAEAAARSAIGNDYARFASSLFRQMFFKPSAMADEIVARAVKTSAGFGPELWPRMARWDAGAMDAALAALHAPVLAIQSTTRNAQLQRAPLKRGDTSPWLEFLKKFPNIRTEIVPDTGHFTQLEAPERVNRLIEEFCR
ncbi:MAG TPA: alpha/beta hydrolase [Burkholderiales bacterium]|nr:alpha/beta hydrolase [Burkholderiales bacterium]